MWAGIKFQILELLGKPSMANGDTLLMLDIFHAKIMIWYNVFSQNRYNKPWRAELEKQDKRHEKSVETTIDFKLNKEYKIKLTKWINHLLYITWNCRFISLSSDNLTNT